MSDHEDYDDYCEPQPPELSGPVAPSRPRLRLVVVPQRRRPTTRPLVAAVAFARPHRTGPPA